MASRLSQTPFIKYLLLRGKPAARTGVLKGAYFGLPQGNYWSFHQGLRGMISRVQKSVDKRYESAG